MVFFVVEEEEEDDPEDEDVQEAIVVLMYLVQPKSMQECCIRFVPPTPDGDLPLSSIIPDTLGRIFFFAFQDFFFKFKK